MSTPIVPSTFQANTPAQVAAFFRRLGLREVAIPGAGAWWADGQGRVGPWDEHLPNLAVELIRLRMFASAAPRPFYRTSEFWMTVAGLAGAGATVGVALAGLSDVPAPWDKVMGLVATAMGTSMPILYKYARARAKIEAANEQERLLGVSHGQPASQQGGTGGTGQQGGGSPGGPGGPGA